MTRVGREKQTGFGGKLPALARRLDSAGNIAYIVEHTVYDEPAWYMIGKRPGPDQVVSRHPLAHRPGHKQRACFEHLCRITGRSSQNTGRKARVMPLDDPSTPADVCVVCALAEEARAFLEMVTQSCQVTFEERLSRRYHYDYRSATITNRKQEPLALHVSWLPCYGPQEMVLHLTRVIEEYRPRMVCMTGICAGDRTRVSLGDLVVAERTFTYDQGAFIIDEQGRKLHQHDTLTYQIEENLLRFLQLFSSPEALLCSLTSVSRQYRSPAHCHIKPMASGSAVRRDNPFQDIQTPVHKAVAIDMEGAAFGRVMRSYPQIPWLVVKGVSDYADVEKDDAYHDLASRASALYALAVLQAYVTCERLPPRAEQAAADQQGEGQQAGPSTQAHQSGSATLLYRYDAHASWVLDVAWEPGGTRIASAGADRTVRVWEAETGAARLTYRGHTRLLNIVNLQTGISTVAWSPDGQRILSAGSGSAVHIWDAASGQTLTLYQAHSGLWPEVWAVAWSPDGKLVASACSSTGVDKTIHIWDTCSGHTLTRYDAFASRTPHFSVLSLAWSLDGARLAATCGDKIIRIWDTATGQPFSHLRTAGPSHLAWSPDCRYLASAHTDHTVQLWESTGHSGKNVMTYHGHKAGVRYVAWSPDGRYLASAANDRTVRIWEALTGTLLHTYQGHSDWVTAVCWSGTGTRLASASNDKTVQIWQMHSGR